MKAIVFLCAVIVGAGIGTWTRDWGYAQHSAAQRAALEAFDRSADGQRLIDCRYRPLLNSVGAAREICPEDEWAQLLDDREAAAEAADPGALPTMVVWATR